MKKYKRSKIVNPKLQFQRAIEAVLGIVITINAFLLAGTLFPIETGLYVNFSFKQYVFVGIIELILVVLVWVWSIRSSHKLVGPAHAFGRELKKLSLGDLTMQVKLRDGDGFYETAEQINKGVINFRLRIEGIKYIAKQLHDPDCKNTAQLIKQLNSELDKFITK